MNSLKEEEKPENHSNILFKNFRHKNAIFKYLFGENLREIFCSQWIDSPMQQIYRPGTPNSDIRKLCTVHCGRNVNKSSAPKAVAGKGLNSDKQSDVTVKNKRN